MEIAEKTGTRSAIKEFSPDEVELLAEMEHRRWLAERRLSNWTYAEKKDVLRRQSNSLVPWERLTDKVRDFNRNEVKEIPSLLESAGMKICKI